MTKTDYAKLFKKTIFWKKAKGVIFIAKNKFSNGKAPLVAIPFRKYTEAAKIFKEEVKKSKTYSSKLSMLAAFKMKKQPDGNLQVEVTPMKGGMNSALLEIEGKELFANLKIGFNVAGDQAAVTMEDLQEEAEAADETLSNKKAGKLANKKIKIQDKLDKIQANLTQFEKAIGKIESSQIYDKLVQYKELLNEASKDGNVDEQEQVQINNLLQEIKELETKFDTSKKQALI